MLQVPNATGYIGCIGKDKFGEEMKKRCSLDGVKVSLSLIVLSLRIPFLKLNFYSFNNQVHYYEIDTAPTGTCAVCVVGGERSDGQTFLEFLFSLL